MEITTTEIRKKLQLDVCWMIFVITLFTFTGVAHGANLKVTNKIHHTVKIVYFFGADSRLSSSWKNRIDRTLKDISAFYKTELENAGYDNDGIPFEKDNLGYKYYVVQGSKPSNDYTIYSGNEIENEIFEKLPPTITSSKEHILVITALSEKDENDTYIFHSPYYGRGSATSGLCMVADCDLLDPLLLADATTKITFTEMFATNRACSVGEFNSWYLGGIAHEMGHLFGLPHDNGFKNEFSLKTISIMGEYGSRHYKVEKWGGEKSAKFSHASLLQLSRHPLFTQRPKPLLNRDEFLLQSFKLYQNEKTTKIKLHYHSGTKPYAVVALIRPYDMSEYLSNSFTSVGNQSDDTEIEIAPFEGNAPHEIRMLFIFANGSVKEYRKMVTQGEGGHFFTVNNFGQTSINDLIRAVENDSKDSQRQVKLGILNQLLQDSKPINLKTTQKDSVFLSDAAWKEASVGWENPARNYYTAESNSLFFLESMGNLYRKGLYAHTPSLYAYKLSKKWRNLKIIAALRDGAQKPEGIKFIIQGNGKTLSSCTVKPNQQHLFEIDITNIDDLELLTQDPAGNNFNAWSIWCNPLLTK